MLSEVMRSEVPCVLLDQGGLGATRSAGSERPRREGAPIEPG